MPKYTSMTPESFLRYQRQLHEATPNQLALAKILQKAAFIHDEPAKADPVVPAPLYMKQAMALSRDPKFAADVIGAIARVYE